MDMIAIMHVSAVFVNLITVIQSVIYSEMISVQSVEKALQIVGEC